MLHKKLIFYESLDNFEILQIARLLSQIRYSLHCDHKSLCILKTKTETLKKLQRKTELLINKYTEELHTIRIPIEKKFGDDFKYIQHLFQ